MNIHQLHKIGKLVIFAIILVSTFNVYSQNSGINYAYDESGNRIKRSPVNETGIIVLEKEDDSFKLQVFPNPTNGLFNINIPGIETRFQVDIFNMVGSSILNREYSEKTVSVNISNYPAGIYLVRVTINGVSIQGKIIKNKDK